jgi:nucleoside 2-deoxyribosyltransferase
MNSLTGKRLYLAGGLFTMAEREFNSRLAAACIERGFDVWLPQDHEPRTKTAKAIFDMDVEGIMWSDVVVANMDGGDPDSGTCWEVGFAYGKRPIICYRTDLRSASDFEGSPYNLMLSQSATRTITVDTLRDPKASIGYLADCIYHNIYYLPRPERRPMVADQFGGFDRAEPVKLFRHADK